MTDATAFGVEISTDRAHTSIVAASDRGEVAVVELVAYLDGSDTAAEVFTMIGDPRRARVVVDPRSPAATLVAPLGGLGIEVVEPTTHDVAVSHGLFLDELKAGRLRFVPHPALDAAAQNAESRHLAGGEALERRRPLVDTGPLVAAELALFALLRVAAKRPPMIHLLPAD